MSRLVNHHIISIRWLDCHFVTSSENLGNERSSPRGFSTIWLRFLSVVVLLLHRESTSLARCASAPNGAAVVVYKGWVKVALLRFNKWIFSCATEGWFIRIHLTPRISNDLFCHQLGDAWLSHHTRRLGLTLSTSDLHKGWGWVHLIVIWVRLM